MNSIENNIEYEYIEKKSKFIVNVKKVKTVKEAMDFIIDIKNKYKDATHNVYSYRILENNMENIRYSDDGEPLNTAGKPSFEILKNLDIWNVCVCITRYFGGIKLGANGLIRAYAKSTKLAIEEANIVEYINTSIYIVETDYTSYTDIENYFYKNNVNILEKSYTEKVNYKIEIDERLEKEIESLKNSLVIKI